MGLHVTFVCSGNIRRSPIAEKVFAAELDRAGLADGVRVTSAGVGGWHVGSPADDRAAAMLRAAGYPDAHRARQVDAELLSADLVVALDGSHRRALQAAVPEPGRVRLLRRRGRLRRGRAARRRWPARVPLHQLFPLLVHAVLFGGGYAQQAVAAARRLG